MPVYGITGNVVAEHPVLQSNTCAFSSNYNDILDMGQRNISSSTYANLSTPPYQLNVHASVSYDSTAVKSESDKESDDEFEMKEDIQHHQCE